MANITVTMDAELLERAKLFSRAQGKSVSEVVRESFEEKFAGSDSASKAWWDDFMRLTEGINGDSGGWKFNREELYER